MNFYVHVQRYSYLPQTFKTNSTPDKFVCLGHPSRAKALKDLESHCEVDRVGNIIAEHASQSPLQLRESGYLLILTRWPHFSKSIQPTTKIVSDNGLLTALSFVLATCLFATIECDSCTKPGDETLFGASTPKEKETKLYIWWRIYCHELSLHPTDIQLFEVLGLSGDRVI